MFFVGWACAAPFAMRLVDVFGRKRVYIIDMSFHAIFFLGILLSKNLTLTITFQFFLGIFAVGRASISFLYLQELLMSQHQALAGSLLQILNGLVTVMAVIYFVYISKYW